MWLHLLEKEVLKGCGHILKHTLMQIVWLENNPRTYLEGERILTQKQRRNHSIKGMLPSYHYRQLKCNTTGKLGKTYPRVFLPNVWESRVFTQQLPSVIGWPTALMFTIRCPVLVAWPQPTFRETGCQAVQFCHFPKRGETFAWNRVTEFWWLQLVMTTALKNQNLTLKKASPRVFGTVKDWKDNSNEWEFCEAGPQGKVM